jgi:hypothetical protein
MSDTGGMGGMTTLLQICRCGDIGKVGKPPISRQLDANAFFRNAHGNLYLTNMSLLVILESAFCQLSSLGGTVMSIDYDAKDI